MKDEGMIAASKPFPSSLDAKFISLQNNLQHFNFVEEI